MRSRAREYDLVVSCRALASLLAIIPRDAGLALAAEIYSPHLDLHQRLLILDSMSAAALQMSTPPSQAKKLLLEAVSATAILPFSQIAAMHLNRPWGSVCS